MNTTTSVLNSTLGDDDLKEHAQIQWGSLGLLLIILGTAGGNVLVCLAVCREKRLQNMTNYFLMSLAIADLLVALLVMPLGMVVILFGYFPLSPAFCVIWVTTDVCMCTASIWHMCTMSMDRYFSLKYPMKYGRNKTKTMVVLKILFVWVVSMSICSPIMISGFLEHTNVLNDGVCTPTLHHFVIYGSLFAFYIPLLIMIVTYILTLRILYKNQERMKGLSSLSKQRQRLRKGKQSSFESDGLPTIPSSDAGNEGEETADNSMELNQILNDENTTCCGMKQVHKQEPIRKHSRQSEIGVRTSRTETESMQGIVYGRLSIPSTTRTMYNQHDRNDQVSEQMENDSSLPESIFVSDFSALDDLPSPTDLSEPLLNSTNPGEKGKESASSPTRSTSMMDLPTMRDDTNEQLRTRPRSLTISSSSTKVSGINRSLLTSFLLTLSQTHSTSTLGSAVHNMKGSFSSIAEKTLEKLVTKCSSWKNIESIRDDTQPFYEDFDEHLEDDFEYQTENDIGIHEDLKHCSNPSISHLSLAEFDHSNLNEDCTGSANESGICQDAPNNISILTKDESSHSLQELLSESDEIISKEKKDSLICCHLDKSEDGDCYSLYDNVPSYCSGEVLCDQCLKKRSMREKLGYSAMHLHKLQLAQNSHPLNNNGRIGDNSTECRSNEYCDQIDSNEKEAKTNGHSEPISSSIYGGMNDITKRNVNGANGVNNNQLEVHVHVCNHKLTSKSAWEKLLQYASKPKKSKILDKGSNGNMINGTVPLKQEDPSNASLISCNFVGCFYRCTDKPNTTEILINGIHEGGLRRNSTSQALSKQRASNEKKASKVLGIIFTIFVVLWTPFFVANVLSVTYPSSVTPELMTMFVWLGWAASLANPIIYTMFNTAFRKAFIRILQCQKSPSRFQYVPTKSSIYENASRRSRLRSLTQSRSNRASIAEF